MSENYPDYAIDIKNLNKIYKGGKDPDKHALKNITLKIKRGSIFALLGPNGAGKSTLINILAGLVNKTSGEAKIWGHDIIKNTRQAKAAIGIVPQELNLDAFFTPEDALDLQAGLYGVRSKDRRTKELLELVGLSDKAQTYARRLSGGMRRRLMVAKAMVHNPPILVLDEPTAGVDIELRQQLWDNVRKLNAMGVTIILTTHYLEEAQELCDTIAIINHGELITCDSKENLLGLFDAKEIIVTLDHPLKTIPTTLKSYEAEMVDDTSLRLKYRPSKTSFDQILKDLAQEKITIKDIATHDADLEDVFLSLTRADDAKAKKAQA